MNGFQRFMAGRNGMDMLNGFLLSFTAIAFFILGLIGSFTGIWWLRFCALVLILLVAFRFLSKNLARRQKENMLLMGWLMKLQNRRYNRYNNYNNGENYAPYQNDNPYDTSGYENSSYTNAKPKKEKDKKDKDHKYFTCMSCGATLRVPKGKGKIEITCPKCKNTIIKRT